MRLSVPHTVFRWTAAALLATVSLGIVAPRNVEAKCGDYVLVGGQADHTPETAGHDLAISVQRFGDTYEPAVPTGQRRCTGPSCSNGNQHPNAPLPTFPEITVRHWGVLAAVAAPASGGVEWAPFPGDSRAPRAVDSSLFRPPR